MYEIDIKISCVVEQLELNSDFERKFKYLALYICLCKYYFCEGVLYELSSPMS